MPLFWGIGYYRHLFALSAQVDALSAAHRKNSSNVSKEIESNKTTATTTEAVCFTVILLGARTLLVACDIATSSKKLLISNKGHHY